MNFHILNNKAPGHHLTLLANPGLPSLITSSFSPLLTSHSWPPMAGRQTESASQI